MSECILKMDEVVVRRGTRNNVLNIKKFVLRPGELVGMIGPNGAGKSTFLQVVNLLQPYKGDFQLFGHEIGRGDKTLLRRRSALVFQDTLLLNDTVFNNVAVALRFRKITTSEIKRRVYKALTDFHCDHLAERSALLLSGGEAKRVCIARALVTDPELLLLDEPFAALDVTTRAEMIREIRTLAEARNIAVILVSHDFSEVLNFAQRAVAIFQGGIAQDDTPEELMRRPVNAQVARLVGMDNILSCCVVHTQGRTVIKFGQGLEFLYHGAAEKTITACCIPGDALQLYDPALSIPGDQGVRIDGVVARVIPGLCSYQILVKAHEESLIVRVPRQKMKAAIHPAAPIKLLLDPREVHLI